MKRYGNHVFRTDAFASLVFWSYALHSSSVDVGGGRRGGRVAVIDDAARRALAARNAALASLSLLA